MKFTDKALRHIGRQLLDRADKPSHQDDSPNAGQHLASPSRGLGQGLGQRNHSRTHTAVVLPFKKRQR